MGQPRKEARDRSDKRQGTFLSLLHGDKETSLPSLQVSAKRRQTTVPFFAPHVFE